MATAKTETRTRPGRCPTHGDVSAQKVIPKLRFPFFVYLVLRWIAMAKPYRCPTCGEKA
jgi:hypothetical protein